MGDESKSPVVRVVDFMGIPLTACTANQFIDIVIGLAKRQDHDSAPAFITYLNAWCSNLAARHHDYAEILRAADCVYADGQAVVWASRLLGRNLPERVNAGDFLIRFCERAAEEKLSLFLAGSEGGISAVAADTIRAAVPALSVRGAEGGYFTDDGRSLIHSVNEAKPVILILGMGAPRQEQWGWQHRQDLDVKVIWCVGALFEYYGEARARAPVWVRRAGLEWTFRLALEPRRLWRRYLVGNVVFIARVCRQALLKS